MDVEYKFYDKFAYIKRKYISRDILIIPREFGVHLNFILGNIVDVILKIEDTSEIRQNKDGDYFIVFKPKPRSLSKFAKQISVDAFRFFKAPIDFRGRVAKYMLLDNINKLFKGSIIDEEID